MLLNDENIRELCTPFKEGEHGRWFEIPGVCKYAYGLQSLIEPFSESVRGNDVISWGLTHAGYDIRLGHTVKIFKNTSGEAINPKKFKDLEYQNRMFDTLKFPLNQTGQEVIIPAHGYILGTSMEWFRIPRFLSGTCVGKCVTGDTMILNPETGEFATIESRGNSAPIATLEGKSISSRSCSRVISNGRKPVFLVKTRSGLSIRATANHPFLTPSGKWVDLKTLSPAEYIMVATFLPFFGNGELKRSEARLLALMIADGQCKTRTPCYTKNDPVMVKMLVRSAWRTLGCYVSPKGNGAYRIVNHFGIGGDYTQKNRCAEWLIKHGNFCNSPDKTIPQVVFQAQKHVIAEFLRVIFSGDGTIYLANKKRKTPNVVVQYSSSSSKLIEGIRHLLTRFGIGCTTRVKKTTHLPSHSISIRKKGDLIKFFREIGFTHGCYKDLFFRENKSIIEPILERAKEKPIESFSPDQITSITPDGEEHVFDVEVKDTHNFVANGIIVHNSTYARSGIIINTTPLEPSWQGHLTIEISNSAPAPATIFVGEGIAQVRLELLTAPPKKDYAEKKGVYQGQTDVTPARVKG